MMVYNIGKLLSCFTYKEAALLPPPISTRSNLYEAQQSQDNENDGDHEQCVDNVARARNTG